jgi:hypothetical protein
MSCPALGAKPAIMCTGRVGYLRSLGVELVPASTPDFFLADTPTAVLVRQVLGAISQFEKTSLVAKLKAARDRKNPATGKCEGRTSWAEKNPELVDTVKPASQAEALLAGDFCRGSPTYTVPAMMNEYFGTKFKIVNGYASGLCNAVRDCRPVDSRFSQRDRV